MLDLKLPMRQETKKQELMEQQQYLGSRICYSTKKEYEARASKSLGSERGKIQLRQLGLTEIQAEHRIL